MVFLGYLCSGTPDRLLPFALWPAFPASDYYGSTDALQVSLPDSREHPFQESFPRSRGWTAARRFRRRLHDLTQSALCGIPTVCGVIQVKPQRLPPAEHTSRRRQSNAHKVQASDLGRQPR
jgi:hypothetical protein